MHKYKKINTQTKKIPKKKVGEKKKEGKEGGRVKE